MNKKVVKAALMAMALVSAPLSANAQSNLLGGLANALSGKNETVNMIANAANNLLGTGKISESSLVGTWKYSQPSVAFESESVLSQLGSSVASTKIQAKLKKGLEKAGVKPGKVSITFNQDKSFVFTVGSKKQNGTYSVSGSTITLTFALTGRVVTANAKQGIGTLQLAMNADKMLQMINLVATKASAYSSQMSAVSSLLGAYNGMYLGLEFTK